MAVQNQEFAKVHVHAFFAIQWTGAALAFLFLIFRLCIRFKSFKKFAIDDYLVIFALACLGANNILWHYQIHRVYTLYGATGGHIPATTSVINNVATLLRTLPAFNVLFNCCLWAVKFSFLVFFRKLGEGSQGRRFWIWWWVVAAICFGTLAGSIGDYSWSCATGSTWKLLANCTTKKTRDEQQLAFRLNTAFDVITDCLILSIPVALLWNLHLPLRKKAMLFGVFALTVITMIIAIIRVSVVPDGMIATDLTWSFTWSNIEMSTSIIVACLGAFRQLYTNKRGDRTPSNSQQSWSRFAPFLFSLKSKESKPYRSDNSHEKPDSTRDLNFRDLVIEDDATETDKFSLPLQGVQVHVPDRTHQRW